MRATFRATRRSCFTSISKAGDITVLRPFCTHASILRDAGVQRNPFFLSFRATRSRARPMRARELLAQHVWPFIPHHLRIPVNSTSRRHSPWSFSCTVHTPIYVRSPSSNLGPRQVHMPLPVRLYVGIPQGCRGLAEMKRWVARGCVHLSLGSLWMGCLGVSIGIKSEALEMVVGGDVWGRGIGGCWVDARPRLVMCTLGCVFVASASC
ncbi:hypothetical protein HBI25_111480 [Parastagonospora nodorum]|nr:hypothetical protein HBH46_043440 [Parastagonospora nodorum]KAH4243326.1 hypothetical protein HBI05_081990 [Parastagonospora nodorum]KAH4244058.1 hypothetical protein HBI06_006990 [Parastagonospora nodorum]KAH4300681.1 hypothetical protein HBI02_151730 [Parastagonospora nodorum]KAH4307088.1 hypothetical protein HBI01_053170 [Parastagonospora nodorum]